MKVELKTIWPLEAKEILETKNVNNRALSSITVQKLANDIKNKSFLLTHQGIAFDESGTANIIATNTNFLNIPGFEMNIYTTTAFRNVTCFCQT